MPWVQSTRWVKIYHIPQSSTWPIIFPGNYEIGALSLMSETHHNSTPPRTTSRRGKRGRRRSFASSCSHFCSDIKRSIRSQFHPQSSTSFPQPDQIVITVVQRRWNAATPARTNAARPIPVPFAQDALDLRRSTLDVSRVTEINERRTVWILPVRIDRLPVCELDSVFDGQRGITHVRSGPRDAGREATRPNPIHAYDLGGVLGRQTISLVAKVDRSCSRLDDSVLISVENRKATIFELRRRSTVDGYEKKLINLYWCLEEELNQKLKIIKSWKIIE